MGGKDGSETETLTEGERKQNQGTFYVSLSLTIVLI